MKDIVNIIGIALVVGVGVLLYRHYQEKERARKEAVQRMEDEELRKKAEADQKRELERLAKVQQLEQQRLEAEHRRKMELQAAEMRRQQEEEARRNQEEEQKRLAEVQKQEREQSEADAEAEAARNAELAAEQDLQRKIAIARRNLNEARTVLADLEKESAEHEKNITASRNIANAAKKFMHDSLARARSWASQMGVKYVDPNNPWAWYSRSDGPAGIKVVQDNREQIRKEMTDYNKQKGDLSRADAQRIESERALKAMAPKLNAARTRVERAVQVLRGLDPGMEPEPAKVEITKYVLKGGREIRAVMAVDGGDVWSLKKDDGAFEVVKKADVERIETASQDR